jgi:cell division transport system ATP-binding protein
LDKVGMKEYSSKMPHQISGGEQQRVAIARALLNDPELILPMSQQEI